MTSGNISVDQIEKIYGSSGKPFECNFKFPQNTSSISKYFSELTVFRKTLLKFVNKGKYKSARFLVKIREIIVKTRMKFKRKEKNGK